MTRTVNEDVRREAEHWFARRREPAVREAEAEAFERWRVQDEAHAQAYTETERLWDRLAILQSSERLKALAVQANTFSPGLSARRRFLLPVLLAASVAAIAVSVVLWFSHVPEVQRFATAIGEQRTETLSDGTTLRMNTQSTLEARMSDNRREVTLENGEAAFDVAKDPSRPFIVVAGDGSVVAVGTHFQVRRESGQVTVTLLEGRVQLLRPSRHEFEWLDPGQQARFSETASGIVRRNVDVAALTSWMSGRLEFRGAPLHDAVEEINRYSMRKIRIGDPSIDGIEISGTFRTGDVDGAVAAFEVAFPVRAETTATEITLLPK